MTPVLYAEKEGSMEPERYEVSDQIMTRAEGNQRDSRVLE